MSESCKVLAAVTIDGLALMGKNPAMPAYVCATSATYFPPSTPYVCAAATGAHIIGKLMQGDAAKGLGKKATERSCDLIVEISGRATRVILVKGKGSVDQIQKAASDATINFKAATSPEGMIRLMNALGR